MKRVLITGITGQDGSYLAEILLEKGYDVHGIVRRSSVPKLDRIEHLMGRINIHEGDLTDFSSLLRTIERVWPDEIYNLAAQSFVPNSWEAPLFTLQVNTMGVANLLEVIRQTKMSAKIYQASTSEMFGQVLETPQKETTPFNPRSPYAISKVCAHMMVKHYRETYGIFGCNGILFNHECVPADTPVVIRRNGLVDVVAIEDVVPHRTSPKSSHKYVSDGSDFDVWDGEEWSKCTARTATWHDEEIVTIHGRGGIIEATEDHVVFLENKEKASGEINKGDHLRLAKQPPLTTSTTLTEDEAWLLGALVAEGYVNEDGSGRIVCGNESLLAEAGKCWEKITAGKATKGSDVKSGFDPGYAHSINLLGNGAYLRMIRKELYTRTGHKRIPIRILNAPPSLQLVFLNAYNLGDGLMAGNGIDIFKSFRTSSSTLACGLIWLARTVLGRRVSVYLQPGMKDCRSYLINMSSGSTIGDKGAHLRKSQNEVRSVDRRSYKGWMFDLATESGRFAAGVGLVVVHNSPRRGVEFVTRKISMAAAKHSLGILDTKLKLGNLDAKRDWGWAPDYVRAMWLMMQHSEADDFVVATGETHSIKEFLDIAFPKGWNEVVEIDPKFIRPAEVNILMGDANKAKEKLEWTPTITFEQLVRKMVDADIKMIVK